MLKARLQSLKLPASPVDLVSMSGNRPSDPSVPTPTPTTPSADVLEAQMDQELAGLRAEAPGRPGHPRNPVFLHEQAAGSAVAADEATETAARVIGELAAEADHERVVLEGQVAALAHAAPGSAAAADAAAALARAEQDADGAIGASLDSDEAAEAARKSTGSHVFHRGADPAGGEADEARALADERVAARDLAELDTLEQRVAADAGAPPAPA